MPFPLMLHAKHDPSAVTYRPMGDWVVPWRFSATEGEHRALTEGVGLLDYSLLALLEARGHDRVAFLHSLLSNDVRRLSAGQGCPAALLTPSAKLITDLLVLADTDALWILCDAIRAKRLMEELERHLFTEQVELTNHERAEVTLAIQGPRTCELLTKLTGSTALLKEPCDHGRVPLGGVPVRLIRFGLAGGSGVLCCAPAESALALWQGLRTAGRPFDLTLVGWEALNVARIEAGIPWFGWDMDESTLLPETGLEAMLASDEKGCYIGQEIVARMATYGSPSKRLVGLVVDGDLVPQPGDRLLRGGEDAGWVTSGCRSFALERPIGLGYAKRGADQPGTRLELLQGESRAGVTVVLRPLVRR